MEMSGYFHASDTLVPEKIRQYTSKHWMERWVGLEQVWTVLEKRKVIYSYQESKNDPAVGQPVAKSLYSPLT